MQIIGHIFYKKAHYLIFCREILIIDIFSAEKQVALGMGDHGTARKHTEKRNILSPCATRRNPNYLNQVALCMW